MKSKIVFFALLILAITVQAQRPVYPKPDRSDNIPFGKKLPPPSLQNVPGSINQMDFDKKRSNANIMFDRATGKYGSNFPGRIIERLIKNKAIVRYTKALYLSNFIISFFA